MSITTEHKLKKAAKTVEVKIVKDKAKIQATNENPYQNKNNSKTKPFKKSTYKD
jgi:hypothetical protein